MPLFFNEYNILLGVVFSEQEEGELVFFMLPIELLLLLLLLLLYYH
jgi:hypothetical protein